jgi:hypothetical protein
LAQGDEVRQIITRITRQRPSEILHILQNDFCNTIPLKADSRLLNRERQPTDYEAASEDAACVICRVKSEIMVDRMIEIVWSDAASGRSPNVT